VRRERGTIGAHLVIVFAALAVTRFTRGRAGWFIKKFVRTARRYRTVQIRAGRHAPTAEDALPPGPRDALAHTKQQNEVRVSESSRGLQRPAGLPPVRRERQQPASSVRRRRCPGGERTGRCGAGPGRARRGTGRQVSVRPLEEAGAL